MNSDYILSWKFKFIFKEILFLNLDNGIIFKWWQFFSKFGSILLAKSAVFLNINNLTWLLGHESMPIVTQYKCIWTISII